MILVPCALSQEEKLELIHAFYNCYYNTDQKEEVYGNEFFYVVGNILGNHVPVQLERLTEFQGDTFDASPGYKAAYEEWLQNPS